MLKTRVIPTLLYRDFGLVKGVGFDSRRAIGSPLQAIKVYEQGKRNNHHRAELYRRLADGLRRMVGTAEIRWAR
jgi:hypothetical protein